jgi:hypothetical protein
MYYRQSLTLSPLSPNTNSLEAAMKFLPKKLQLLHKAVISSLIFLPAPGVSAAPTLTPGVWTNIDVAGIAFSAGTEARFTQSMVIDPTNPDIIYLCVCGVNTSTWAAIPMGIYKTTDRGSTWRKIGKITAGIRCSDTIDAPIQLRVNPLNPQQLYCADGVRGCTLGFLVSTDGGETFAMPAGFEEHANSSSGGWVNDVYDVAADPTDWKHILLSFHSPFENLGQSGVIESKDGGTTWKRFFPIGSGVGPGCGVWFLYKPELGIGNSSTWLLGAQMGGGHWRTTDAGASWTKVSDVNMEHGGGSILYAANGTLYVSGQPSLLRSTDNGATWKNLNPGASAGYVGIGSDGVSLFAKAHDFDRPFVTAKLSNDTSWSEYGNHFYAGSFSYGFDSVNHILYAACVNAGLWALKIPGTRVEQKANDQHKNNAGIASSKPRDLAVRKLAPRGYSRALVVVKQNVVFDVRGKMLNK